MPDRSIWGGRCVFDPEHLHVHADCVGKGLETIRNDIEGTRASDLMDEFKIHGRPCLGAAILMVDVNGNYTVDRALEYDVGENPMRDGVLKQPIKVEQGIVTVGDAPGLGIEVDEEAVKRFRIA